jgi:ribosome biogenesis GTPase
MDLVNRLPENAALYHALNLPIFPISCTTGNGIEALRKTLCNKTSVLAGHSGVGKSSLLNALDPNLRVVTREVSESTKRGKHATTASTLYQLQGGIKIIDTPGIRSLGLWNVSPEEVSFYFPEIAEVSRNCRFRDCTHTHEPDCAVRKAAETGILPPERYASYKRIRECLESE